MARLLTLLTASVAAEADKSQAQKVAQRAMPGIGGADLGRGLGVSARQGSASSPRWRPSRGVQDMTVTKPPRIGNAMRELADVVSACPGICKSKALRATGRPVKGLGCWRLMERAIGAGLIIEDRANPWVPGNCHALFANDRARQTFNLRQELLHSSPSPDRAQEIAAEIEVLRERQATTWVT